jgi:hypothetical protein
LSREALGYQVNTVFFVSGEQSEFQHTSKA